MHLLPLIWLLATPPATADGACVEPADHGWLAAHHDRLEDISKDCAFECLTDDAACASRCIEQETRLGAACSACFGAFVDCTTSNCALRCMVASSDMCFECRTAHCGAAFERCAGVEVRR